MCSVICAFHLERLRATALMSRGTLLRAWFHSPSRFRIMPRHEGASLWLLAVGRITSRGHSWLVAHVLDTHACSCHGIGNLKSALSYFFLRCRYIHPSQDGDKSNNHYMPQLFNLRTRRTLKIKSSVLLIVA